VTETGQRSAPGSRTSVARFTLPSAGLVDGLSAVSGTGSRAQAAAAACATLLALPGVRGAAVVQRDAEDAVVLGSAGYPCGDMGPGARLPLSAGLPVTEAVRTRRPVVVGQGPSWAAVPLGRGGMSGALLVSLVVGPPVGPDLAALEQLAAAVGDALARAHDGERSAGDLVAPGGRPQCAGLEVAVRRLPHDGRGSGDVLLAVPDGRGGSVLLVADVCGSGFAAALLAGAVTTAAVAAVAAGAVRPVALLEAVEQAVRPLVPPGSFVTALAGHVRGGVVELASAGHPPPVVLHPDGAAAQPLSLIPGPPLALEVPDARADALTPAVTRLPDGAVLLLHTDGLVERRTPDGVRAVDVALLAAGLGTRDLEGLADQVLARADAAGDVADDVGLLLVRRDSALRA
jgi:Stage II sporulation protein E (SpoIIE)